MNFPEIPRDALAIIQLILFAVILFNYIRRKYWKIEAKQEDSEKVEWSVGVGLGSMALLIVAMPVFVFLYPAKTEEFSRVTNNMVWITWILMIIGFAYIEYKFRKKKPIQ